MKTATILFITGLIMFPVIALAQTSEIQSSSTQPAPTDTQRCWASSYKFFNECGAGMYKNVYAECSDGFAGITLLEDTSCKSYEVLTRSADEACADHCLNKIEIPAKCGISIFENGSECGVGLYARPYIQCYDGFEVILGDYYSCKSAEAWSQFITNDTCINRCSLPQSSEPPTTPVIPETAVSAKEQTPTPTTPGASAPTNAATLSPIKCGVFGSVVSNECGAGVYKNISARCYDGFEIVMGEGTSCKSSETWQQYANEKCANHCSSVYGTSVVSKPSPQPTESSPVIYNTGDDVGVGNRSTPLAPSSVPTIERKWISVCSISDNLMQNYNELILELQKQEAKSDKIKAEEVTRQIVAQKQYIEAQKKACADNPQTAWQVAAPLTPVEIKSVATKENKSVEKNEKKPTVTTVGKPIENQQVTATESRSVASENNAVVFQMDRCNEMTKWGNKIAYYKKLSNLSDADLKKEGFSREEMEKILQELLVGTEKVRTQCANQEKTPVIPRVTAATGRAFIVETVKPVVAESGQEISAYYKTRIEKAVSSKGEEKQIEELKTLKDEIDGLISNLIKSRKELEVSELNTLVKEVKVSRGEIKADDISVKTTEKKMLINVGDRPVSVEPTENQVIIRDKGLEVNTDEVTIKENVLSVGGVDVKMSASEVTEKLGLTPTIIELKEENAKAVYNIKIDERRKLFGFIPLNVQRVVAADAENGNTLSDQRPWYNFLTTK